MASGGLERKAGALTAVTAAITATTASAKLTATAGACWYDRNVEDLPAPTGDDPPLALI
jgi:hypothetical protein